MQAYQTELESRQKRAIELTYEIEETNNLLATLRLHKEQMESELKSVIGHDYEGSKTYEIGDRSVTIKTDLIYALDKKAYINGDYFLPPEFDPIVQKTTFEVNKKLFNKYDSTSPLAVRELLNTLVTKKEANLKITIKARS